MWELIRHTEEEIEALRTQMHYAAANQGRLSDNVLYLSQELDNLLNLYEYLKVKAGRS